MYINQLDGRKIYAFMFFEIFFSLFENWAFCNHIPKTFKNDFRYFHEKAIHLGILLRRLTI